MMKRKRKSVFSAACFCLLMSMGAMLTGCSPEEAGSQSTAIPDSAALIYQETLSPNKDYVSSSEDVVNLSVKIYQAQDDTIFVQASSNSPLMNEQQYSLSYEKSLSQEDIRVTWTTPMGRTQPTEEDQLVVADIALFDNGEIFSERKINFSQNAMDIITETLEQNS